jgi:hypothetical protein
LPVSPRFSLDQGFEIDAGGAECKNTGKMTFDEARAYRQSFGNKWAGAYEFLSF